MSCIRIVQSKTYVHDGSCKMLHMMALRLQGNDTTGGVWRIVNSHTWTLRHDVLYYMIDERLSVNRLVTLAHSLSICPG